MSQLKEGMAAPGFEGVDQNGKYINSKSHAEQIFGLYK